MLYTEKGDKGTTKTYGCDQRISKGSAVAEALWSLDEVNSFLGVVEGTVVHSGEKFHWKSAALARLCMGSINTVHGPGRSRRLPDADDRRESSGGGSVDRCCRKLLPPIKTFFISGGTELAASFDVARLWPAAPSGR